MPVRDAQRTWDALARRDPVLATAGYNACAGYRSREELGSLATALPWLSPVAGERILDLGCGWGKMSLELSALGARPVGLDLSGEMLRAGRSRGLASLVQGWADRLPFADRSFDRVWSHSLLMHLDPRCVERVVAEVARVLRPGGTACLHFKGGRHASELLLALWGLFRGGARAPWRRRGTDPGWVLRLARRHFRRARLAVESFQLLPLSLPVEDGGGDLAQLGVPSGRGVRFRHLLPERAGRLLLAAGRRLARLANGRWPGLAPFGKELYLVASQPRHVPPVVGGVPPPTSPPGLPGPARLL